MNTLTETEDEIKDDIEACVSEHTHTFPDIYIVLDFCICKEWQIIEVQSQLVILCINIFGKTCFFERA